MKLAIIVPAYNEEKRIGRMLGEYLRFFENSGLDYEIKVIINGTTDDTPKIVNEFSKGNPNISGYVIEDRGKGRAVSWGFKQAFEQGFDLIGFVDADLATSPESFYALILNLKEWDGVIAGRWLKDSQVKDKAIRHVTSRGFNFVVRSMFFMPYSDTQCGAKLFTRESVGKILPKMTASQWAFDVNLLYLCKRKGLKIKEIPTVWENVEGSKVNLLRTPLKMFISITRLRLFYSPLKFLVTIYDKLPGGLKLHNKL